MTTQTKKEKFTYLYVVQGHYGQGWEDEDQSETYAEARASLSLYYANMPEYQHRIISRRTLNQA